MQSVNLIRLPHIFNKTPQKEQEINPVNELLYAVLLLRGRVDRNNVVLCPQINFLVSGKTFASPVHVPNLRFTL
jgi:hypothetical protein